MSRSSHFLKALIFALAALATSLFGQPLPTIALSNAFPGMIFELPVGLVESPDGSGRFFIVGQNGIITVVHKNSGSKDAKEFLNISDRQPHVAVEDGLLGLAFHPGFKTNGLFYIYYTQANPLHTILSELKVSAADPDLANLQSERVVLNVPQPFEDHKAGQLKFGPDGFLYIGLGDGGRGNDPFNNGQNTAVLLGKILRIDVNTRSQMMAGGKEQPLGYGIPANNPFVNEPERYEYGVRKEIWAYGFRNPWRFSFDRETGELWAGDVGQDSWEGIDLIVRGENYGWCVREGSHHFKPGPAKAAYNEPIMEYPHTPQLLAQSRFPRHSIGSCVIGGYVYRGKKYPSLAGVYIYADYVLGTFWGLRYHNGKVTESATLLEQPKNVTSFGEDSEGELYAVTYDGHIFHITVPGN